VSARSAAALLTLAAALAGCGGGDDRGTTGSEAEKSCPARLTWEDEEYLGSGVRLPPERGKDVGEATIPACGPNDERKVRVTRIPGVDPSIALGNPEDAFSIWIAEAGRGQEYPAALDRIVFGLSCEESEPFVLAGRWVGVVDEKESVYVQLDVDRTDTTGRPYQRLVIDLAVRESTTGLDREAFSQPGLGRSRFRARVRCVEADKPNRTFLAESIEKTSGG
jgi:hypothetical protein